MIPDQEMQRQIRAAAEHVAWALPARLVKHDGALDVDRLPECTQTVQRLLRTRRTPISAVYVAWDTAGRCEYVGSVHRPRSIRAVRDRIAEHLAHDERRARWYAVTIFPLRSGVGLEGVRRCENAVAFRLRPMTGCAHPRTSSVDRRSVDHVTG